MAMYGDLDAAPITNYLMSDDIWKRYQIEEMQLQSMPIIELVTTCSMLCQKNCEVENDFMWNGHKGTNVKRMCKDSAADEEPKTPAAQVQQSVLKSAFKMNTVDPNTIMPMTPNYHYSIQTPPISDDEDSKRTETLEDLETAIYENYIYEDDDLSDYFKGDKKDFGFFDEDFEEEEEEEEKYVNQKQKQADQMRAFYAAESDHSYHKGTHEPMPSGNLGIDTPSDSEEEEEEEEIDVVSLGDKFSINRASAGVLPTNPSTRDRRQLQQTMQNRFPRGVKTRMPVKRVSAAGPSQSKGKTRNNGRSRQHKRVNQTHRQYKRRTNYSSDSEQEPSEKRSLHNNMERQRRIDLRNLFNDLKKLVPEVNKKKAAKVQILRAAAQYCRDLTYTNVVLERRETFLRKQQERLRLELSQLRRNFAAQR